MDENTDVGALTDEQIAAALSEAPEAPEAPPPESLTVETSAPPPPPAPEPVAEQPKHVPLGDLLEERGRRKEMQARLEEMERRFAEFASRAQQAVTQQPTAAEPSVRYEDDPIEYLRQQQAAVTANLHAVAQAQQELVQRQQAEKQWAAMREQVGAAEAAFVKQTPDYYDAVSHLRDQRKAQLLGAGMSEAQALATIQQDAVAIANEAIRLGYSPAQYAYRVAQGAGWQPKPKAPPPASPPKSLGEAAGRQDSAMPSVNDLDKMSDKEFEKVFNKLMTGT